MEEALDLSSDRLLDKISELWSSHESDLMEYDVLGVCLNLKIDVRGSPKISVRVYRITWSCITEGLTFVSCKSNVLTSCII